MALVDIFNAEMQTRFLDAYMDIDPAKPAPYEAYTETVPSNNRIESYVWMSPSPGLQQYKGHRRFGKIDRVSYDVSNLEYDAGFQVPIRDIEDDKTGGYLKRAAQMGKKAQLYPGRAVLKNLSKGQTNKCFDGTVLFASTHTIGTWPTNGNLLTGTAAASDSVVHNLVFMVHGGDTTSFVKPLIWQNRKPFRLENNAGTKESMLAKKVSYWVDGEGAATYGFHWDILQVHYANTPTVVELHTDLATVATQFRGVYLPQALASDDKEYVHEQIEFNQDTMTILASATGIEEVLRQALNQDMVPQTIGNSTVAVTNRFKGWGNMVVSSFINTIS
jgi:phage major head subunit gpT-like protein